MADDKIHYSDMVAADDSIKELISQLEQLNATFKSFSSSVKSGAQSVAASMKSISGATSEGKAAIDAAAVAAERLKKAQMELAIAQSETGKQIALIKDKTRDVNHTTVENANTVKAAASSYDGLKQTLKENIELWKALTDAERAQDNYGKVVLATIHKTVTEIKRLDEQLKPVVISMSELEKAERKLNASFGEEERRLMEVQRAIRQLNRERELEVTIANSAPGSYNQLSAQYELNKMKLNAMSNAMRTATDEGKKLEAKTLDLYKKMMMLQETTGNHRLSVGNYAKAWNGLRMSVNQIIREMPAAAMGVNTFFLAISNNVPIFVDEVQRVIEKNKQLAAEGRKTVNVTKEIAKAVFGWQTVMMIGLTVLSMYGKKIFEYISSLIKAKDATISTAEAMKNISEEAEKNSTGYSKNITALQKLKREWNELASDEDRKKFLKQNQDVARQLDVHMNSITEAERLLVDGTDAYVESLKYRAKATAATAIAAKKYEEVLTKQLEIDTEKSKTKREDLSFWESNFRFPLAVKQYITDPSTGEKRLETEEELIDRVFGKKRSKRIEKLEGERDAAEKTADAYMELANANEKEADALLKLIGLEKYYTDSGNGGTGRRLIDLTHTINMNDISVYEKYEAAITKLTHDEFAKRRLEIVKTATAENEKLKEKLRLNEEYVKNVDGKYKELTESQVEQLNKQNEQLRQTMTLNTKKMEYDLHELERQKQIRSLEISREGYENNIALLSISLEEEKALMLQSINEEEAYVKETNKLLAEKGRSEEEITLEYAKKRLSVESLYSERILDIKKRFVDNSIALAKKGSEEELAAMLVRVDYETQLELAKNARLPASQQQDPEQIRAKGTKRKATTYGGWVTSNASEDQKYQMLRYENAKHTALWIKDFELQQEIEMWNGKIALAKQGALEWSDAQIKAAEETVKKLRNEQQKNKSLAGAIYSRGSLIGGFMERFDIGDEDQIAATEKFTNFMIEQLQSILSAEVEVAEAEVELAKKRTQAFEDSYKAEVEARNKGYANNVATAKKELQLQRKNQAQKEKELQKAKNAQLAVESVMQASSLVTASAQIWAAFAATPPLAISMIALMFGSYAFAKIRAAQVSKAQQEEYGEGGLEFLEGGSHASGNDIDLHTKNSNGKNMRAEGGEAMAIINKRNTRKYKKQLPGIIDALNKGIFEDKYMSSFGQGDAINAKLTVNQSNYDLSRIESSVEAIKKQNDVRCIQIDSETTLMIKGNVKQYIRN